MSRFRFGATRRFAARQGSSCGACACYVWSGPCGWSATSRPLIGVMHRDPNGAAIYMVCHGSHQYTPVILALIYYIHGSVMGLGMLTIGENKKNSHFDASFFWGVIYRDSLSIRVWHERMLGVKNFGSIRFGRRWIALCLPRLFVCCLGNGIFWLWSSRKCQTAWWIEPDKSESERCQVDIAIDALVCVAETKVYLHLWQF